METNETVETVLNTVIETTIDEMVVNEPIVENGVETNSNETIKFEGKEYSQAQFDKMVNGIATRIANSRVKEQAKTTEEEIKEIKDSLAKERFINKAKANGVDDNIINNLTSVVDASKLDNIDLTAYKVEKAPQVVEVPKNDKVEEVVTTESFYAKYLPNYRK